MTPRERELVEMFRNRVTSIEGKFRTSRERLADAPLVIVAQELEELLSDEMFQSITKFIVADAGLQRKAASLRRVYERYYFFRERTVALHIINGMGDASFVSNNHALGVKEIEAAHINASHHVFFMGSGPFPWTAIAYVAVAGCRVTCFDRDPEAVVISRKLVEKLGMTGSVRIEQGDASLVDYREATHVVIAGMTRPKRDILKRIADTSSDTITIIARSSRGLFFFMYEEFPTQELRGFCIECVAQPAGRGELVSYILKKEKRFQPKKPSSLPIR